MKPIRMLGFVALIALLAIALIGSSSAMAESTALCKVDESPCSAGNQVTHAHESTLSGAKMIWLSSLFNIECDLLFLGATLSGLTEQLAIHGSFTYSNCNNSCIFTEENGPAAVNVLRTDHETATFVGEWLIHMECGFFFNCRYNGVGVEGTAKGSLLSSEANGDVSVQFEELNRESGFCPEVVGLDFKTTPLSPLYIAT